MLCVKDNLRKEALLIMNSKSTNDNAKALKDFLNIDHVINNIHSYGFDEAQRLDEKLRKEYIEIKILQMAVNAFPITDCPLLVKNGNASYPVIERLKFDSFGVCLSVLLKNNVIHSPTDFIESVQ